MDTGWDGEETERAFHLPSASEQTPLRSECSRPPAHSLSLPFRWNQRERLPPVQPLPAGREAASGEQSLQPARGQQARGPEPREGESVSRPRTCAAGHRDQRPAPASLLGGQVRVLRKGKEGHGCAEPGGGERLPRESRPSVPGEQPLWGLRVPGCGVADSCVLEVLGMRGFDRGLHGL